MHALSLHSTTISPSSPTEDDIIDLTLDGAFSNGCGYIISENVEIVGNTIFVQIIAGYTSGFCTQALVPWQVNYSLGRLPAGVYQLNFTQSVGVNVSALPQPITVVVAQGQIPATLQIGQLPPQMQAGSAVQIPLNINGAFHPQSVFIVQLSDANGSFSQATSIGSCTGVACTSIAVMIPSNLAPGTYSIRVVSSAPVVTSQILTIVIQGAGSCPLNGWSWNNITDTTASIVWNLGNWTPDPNDRIILHYRKVGATDISVIDESANGSSTMTGLVPCTDYEFRYFYQCYNQGSIANSIMSIWNGFSTDCQGIPMNVSITGTNPTCFQTNNGKLIAHVTGGNPPYQFSWNTSQQTDTLNNLGAGTFTVTITNATGQTITSSYSLSWPPQLSTQLNTTHLICSTSNLGSVMVNPVGGTPPFTYAWSSNQTAAALSGISVGTYTVTVSDAHQCTTIGIANVINTQSGVLFDTLISGLNCQNALGSIQVTPTNGLSPYQYLWNTGQTTSTIQDLAAGNYTVTITENSGCTSVASFSLPAWQSPLVSIVGTTGILCPGTLDTLVAMSAGNNSYLWSTGATSQAIPIQATPQTYTVTITDTDGCTSTASQTIAVYSLPTLSISADSVVCMSQPTTLTATLNPVQPQANFSWSGAVSAMGNSITVTPYQPYNTYSLTVRDDNQCLQDTSVVIRTGELQVSLGDSIQSLCTSGTVVLQVSTPNATVAWSNLGTQAALGSTLQLQITAPGYYQAIVNQNVCADTVVVQVTGNNLIAPADVSHSDCFTPSGNISLAPAQGKIPYSAHWADGATGLERNGLTPGTYMVTVSDADGCTLMVQPMVHHIPVQPQQYASILGSNQILGSCYDTVALVSNLPQGSTGLWTASQPQAHFNGPNQAQTRLENILPNTPIFAYWTLSTPGCPNYSRDSIRVLFTESIPMLENDTATQVEGNTIVLFQQNNDFLPPSAAGFFTEIVQNPIGQPGDFQLTDSLFRFTPATLRADTVFSSYRMCNELCSLQCDTAEMVLIFYKLRLGDGSDIVITPNGDGMNDGLYFDYLENTLFQDNQLYIYNRWGSLVFRESPYSNGTWSGESNDAGYLPAGTYYFILRLEKDESRTVYGNLLILR